MLTGGQAPQSENLAFAVSYSTDSGTTWTRQVLTGSTGLCRSIAVVPNAVNILYAGGHVSGSGAVFRSTDFGRNWTRTAGVLPDSVMALAVRPADRSYVIAATLAGLCVSTDAGESWQTRSGTRGLREAINLPWATDTFVLAGDSGVMLFCPASNLVTDITDDLPAAPATCVTFSKGWLVVGTEGRACYGRSPQSGVADPAAGSPALGSGLRVWPNPVRGLAQVLSPGSGRLELRDVTGRLVARTGGPRLGDGLTPGVYFVREQLKPKQQAQAVRKVVVTR